MESYILIIIAAERTRENVNQTQLDPNNIIFVQLQPIQYQLKQIYCLVAK